MSYAADMRFPGSPDLEALEAACEAAVIANANWLLERPRELPHCCKCLDLRWHADRPAERHTFFTLEEMIARPKKGWSCKELAIAEAAILRAQWTQETGQRPARSIALARVVLEPAPAGNEAHAVVMTGHGVRLDPSAEAANCCIGCHFDFEEENVFPHLPPATRRHLKREHDRLRRKKFPHAEVERHAAEEMIAFRQAGIDPAVLERIERDHEMFDRGTL